MEIKLPGMFFPLGAALFLLFLAACQPAVFPATQMPTQLPTFTPSPSIILTDTPCDGPCSSDPASMTATAAMGLTLAAIPTNTPPPGATIIPSAGDLGWGAVYGQIRDEVTGLPIEGAMVKCEHFSYNPTYPCKGTTTTDSQGAYFFKNVFFHDTDRIVLTVEAPGYTLLHFEQTFFTRPEFHVNLGLFPVNYSTETPTPLLMCTAPACEGGNLVCGNSSGCPGGCGTICLPYTATPAAMCTAPVCNGGNLVCGNSSGCPGGCGTVCLPYTATP
jgi:hypothetical protein